MTSMLSLLDMENLSLFMEVQEKGGVFGETGGDDFGFVDGGVGNESPILELIAGTERDALHQESTCDLPSDPLLEDWMETMDLRTLLGDALDETEELLTEDFCSIPCDLLQADDSEGPKVEMQPESLITEISCLNDSGIDIFLHSSPEPPSPESSSSLFDSSRSSSPSTVASSSLEELLLADTISKGDQSYDDMTSKASRSVKSKRSKPYSRIDKSKSGKKASVTNTVDDTIPIEFLNKKDRKKIQNKNAAIRYRQKKKMEGSQIVTEMAGLESRNVELTDKVDQLTREIKYMKDLIAEIYKAKGLIKS